MLGQSSGSSAVVDNRIFVYEVSGLQPNSSEYQLRASGNALLQVPYRRMNEKMQQILRMGGKIVSIKPISGDALAPKSEDHHHE
jgi:hypothetical protein